jgi:hypothetical protein
VRGPATVVAGTGSAPREPSSPWGLLAGIVLIGGALRFWGILHGLREGFIYHLDALPAVHDAWHHFLGAPWSQARFGTAYSVLLTAAMRTFDEAGRLLGYPPPWSFELISAVSSLLTATLGTATVAAAYLVGVRAYDRPTGLLAAALLAVSPLHGFQSHYPYRDVPMVFFLTLTLAACVRLALRPSPAAYAWAGLGAAVTVALKPAGLAVAAPLAVAALIALVRTRRLWILGATVGLAVGMLLALAWFRGDRMATPGAVAGRLLAFVFRGFPRQTVPVLEGVPRATRILLGWEGLPQVVATGLGVAWGGLRRRPADLVLVAFVVPAFVAAALYRFLDERFLVYVLPAGAVLLARLAVDGWRASRGVFGRAALGLAVTALLVAGLFQSAWHGVLLSLPDTRALAGRWLDAHVPRTTRIAMEEYAPLGVSDWPNARMIDARRPLAEITAGTDVVVTSSIEHQRYLEDPGLYRAAAVAFARELPSQVRRIKSLALVPLGFIHPTIDIYTTAPPPARPLPRLLLPRPYDSQWDDGVAFLDTGAYDRDDRTVWLSGAQAYTATLVSRAPVPEMAVFVYNGPEPSRVRARVGWTSRTRTLTPWALQVIRFRPRWLWPARPALYRYEVGLLPEGTQALVQLRSGPREIGEAYAQWNEWGRALPYLERAAGSGGPETRLLLAAAYERLGRPGEARRTLEGLVAAAPALMDRYRVLARAGAAPEGADAAWAGVFRAATGLDPALLTAALAQTFPADQLPVTTGRVLPDPAASAGTAVSVDRRRDPPGIVVNGPRVLHLARGAYRAWFSLRAWDPVGPGPVAVVRVFADNRILAARSVPAAELDGHPGFVAIPVLFVHDDQHRQVAFQVEGTGRASLAVDRVRLEPDLRGTLRGQLAVLDLLDAAAVVTGQRRVDLLLQRLVCGTTLR